MGRLRVGRFKSKGVIVRDLEDVKIIFWNPHCIYVLDKKGIKMNYVFHRYGSPIGFYTNNWKKFRWNLMWLKKLDLNKCVRIANRFDVLYYATIRELDLDKVKVIKRDYVKRG